jgi:hypothetical protein
MSRNGFADCEREYNRREEAIEMAKYQRSEAERVGSPQPNSNTQSSDHPTTADDLLRQARLCIDPFEYPDMAEEIDDYLKGASHE